MNLRTIFFALLAVIFTTLSYPSNADSRDTGVFLHVGAGYELWQQTFGRNPYALFKVDFCYGFADMPASVCLAPWQHMSAYRDGKPFNHRLDRNVLDGPYAEFKLRIW
jgi:hypothetical protein